MNAENLAEIPTTRETPVIRLRQDDPTADWTAPGDYAVDAGLYRIPLPLSHDHLKEAVAGRPRRTDLDGTCHYAKA